MGKKLNALANGEDQNLSEAIRASAQQIWQAGLGAFAVAEKEGGKLFAKLVKDGINIQNRTKHLGDLDVHGAMSQVAANFNKQAFGSWEKIEKVFEDRVSSTLNQLGVPTSKDLEQLTQRVDELSRQIAGLKVSAPATQKAAAKKVAADKPATKKPAARKPAARKPTATVAAAKERVVAK